MTNTLIGPNISSPLWLINVFILGFLFLSWIFDFRAVCKSQGLYTHVTGEETDSERTRDLLKVTQ